MKNLIILIKISSVLFVFSFTMAIGEFLALHDIWQDYVSFNVIESYKGSANLNLPEWSKTALEWKMVNISGLIQLFYLAFSLVTLVACLKALQVSK